MKRMQYFTVPVYCSVGLLLIIQTLILISVKTLLIETYIQQSVLVIWSSLYTILLTSVRYERELINVIITVLFIQALCSESNL